MAHYKFCNLSRKLQAGFCNNRQFPCLYHIPIFQQHFSTNRRNPKQTRKPLYFHAKLKYYHGNCWLLPDSTIFSPIAILSAASGNTKIGAHHPPWWTPPSLKNLDFKPFFNTFACKYQKSYGIISELPPVPLLYFDDFYPSLPHLPHLIRLSTNGIRQNPFAFMRNPV